MVGISLFIDTAVSGEDGREHGLFCFGIVETTCNRRTSGCHSWVSAAESSSLHQSSYQKQVSRILTFSTCSHTAELDDEERTPPASLSLPLYKMGMFSGCPPPNTVM